MPTEDPDLVKARVTAASIWEHPDDSVEKYVVAALLRAQADGVEKANELGQFDSMSRYAKRLRVLADREEGKNS